MLVAKKDKHLEMKQQECLIDFNHFYLSFFCVQGALENLQESPWGSPNPRLKPPALNQSRRQTSYKYLMCGETDDAYLQFCTHVDLSFILFTTEVVVCGDNP